MKKKEIEKYFKGKKITQMGIGGFGRATREAEFLLKYGVDLIITDSRDESVFPRQIKELKDAEKKYKKNGAKLSLFLGKKQKMIHYKNRDIVFYPNGAKLDDKFILYAKKNSAVVTKSIAYLFWIVRKEFGDKVKTIGVTGTKGKSTTTTLIEEVLKNNGDKVWVCGNVRGSVNLPILEKISEGDFLLAELDSWLLQGFGDLKISPDYSLFTNFFEDHQNYYHSMKKYFYDKSNIFRYQKKDQYLFLTNQSKKELKKYFKEKIKSKKIISRYKKLPKWKFSLLGNHNLKNISLVYSLGEILKIKKSVLKKTFENFKAVEGRMEFLGDKKGIDFWNDNNSTTPESTILTIRSLRKRFPKKRIILIGGGTDKNFNYSNLSKIIEKEIKNSFLFSGTATDKIINDFSNNFKYFKVVHGMEEAFRLALDVAEKGDIILLSPGASSFSLFKNEYDRNDQFIKLFNKFKK